MQILGESFCEIVIELHYRSGIVIINLGCRLIWSIIISARVTVCLLFSSCRPLGLRLPLRRLVIQLFLVLALWYGDPDTSPKCFTASLINTGLGSHRPGSLPFSRWFYIDLLGSSVERPLLLARAAESFMLLSLQVRFSFICTVMFAMSFSCIGSPNCGINWIWIHSSWSF